MRWGVFETPHSYIWWPIGHGQFPAASWAAASCPRSELYDFLVEIQSCEHTHTHTPARFHMRDCMLKSHVGRLGEAPSSDRRRPYRTPKHGPCVANSIWKAAGTGGGERIRMTGRRCGQRRCKRRKDIEKQVEEEEHGEENVQNVKRRNNWLEGKGGGDT